MNALAHRERRAFHPLVLVFSLLASGIILVAVLHYRNYVGQFRAEVENQLTAIAELKADELVQYREERLGDAKLFHHNPAFSQLVSRFLRQPPDAEARLQLQAWLSKYEAHYQYDRVLLLDPQGGVRLSSPQTPSSAAPVIRMRVPEVLQSGQVAFQDFYRGEPDQRIYLSLLVPLYDEADGNRPLGVLVLRIDPSTYLYPFISRWPVPSATAETLLVRREGNEAVFLNELRFQTNTALNLRRPLTDTDLPAARAALGQRGIMEGRDYRGVPVVAALQPIPDSPWYLVARRDATAAFAPMRERLWMTVMLVAALLLGTATGTGTLWRRQQVRFYRERAEAAELLRASEVRYRRLFETAKDGLLILDATTGMVLDVNPFLTELLGCSHAEFLGKRVWELNCFKGIVANQDRFSALQQQEYLRHENLALTTGAGRRIEVEFTSNVYRMNDQQVIQCSLRDISERKSAEEFMRRERDFSQAALDSLPGLFYLFDEQGRFLRLNHNFERVSGYSADELAGMTPLDLFGGADQERIAGSIRQVFQTGEVTVEAELRSKDQTRTPYFFTGRLFHFAHKACLIGMGIDITQRRQAEAQLKRTLADLERSNRELEQFAYVASHDLQEPLRMVSSYTQLLSQRYAAQLDDKARKYIHYAVDGAIRMQTLINDLLAYSRVGTRGKPLETTDSHAVLGEAIRNLAATIEETQTLITNDNLPTLPADASQLVLVFQNLLANAIKFRGQDSPRIHVSAQDHGLAWRFAVRDNGIGIEPQHAQRVFVIFQRLHTRAEYPGTGIGLAVCKRIVERHGGDIWFESEPGHGTTFFFTLPK